MPRSLAKSLLLITVLSLLGNAALVQAQISIGRTDDGLPEFGVGIGYSNIDLNSPVAHDQDALHFVPSLSCSPIGVLPQLRLSANIGTSFVFDNSIHTIIVNNGSLTIAGSSSIPLWLLEPELSLSWRQTFGKEGQGVFVEPGIAGGGAFGFLDLDNINGTGNSYTANSSTGYGRVFLRAGGVSGTGIFGLEGSYLQGGHMDFGGSSSGDLKELYIGVFASFRF